MPASRRAVFDKTLIFPSAFPDYSLKRKLSARRAVRSRKTIDLS
jgi:hypothetical protein